MDHVRSSRIGGAGKEVMIKLIKKLLTAKIVKDLIKKFLDKQARKRYNGRNS